MGTETNHKAGFVNIFGLPNAGKSTLLNALLNEKLAIISPKVQTTRHRILGILTEDNYQIVLSDTPGIIDPQYKLHNKMMQQVKSAAEDADVALIVVDVNDEPATLIETINALHLKSKKILLLNKMDTVSKNILEEKLQGLSKALKTDKALAISALKKLNTDKIIPAVLEFLPDSPPYFPDDDISDRSVRFFVSELIREQIYFLYDKEIPYHTAVLIQSYEELPHITKIRADIIVMRETQKMILLGQKGAMMKKLGTQARKTIEEFTGQKVYLELFVKVRPKWRENDTYLREYGY